MPSNRQERDATKSKNGLFEPTGKEADARICTTCNLEELDAVENDVQACVEVKVEVVSSQHYCVEVVGNNLCRNSQWWSCVVDVGLDRSCNGCNVECLLSCCLWWNLVCRRSARYP